MNPEPLNTPTSDWSPCPEGEISGMVRSLKRKKRQQAAQQVAALSVVVLAAGLAIWRIADVSLAPIPEAPQAAHPRRGEPTYGGIACSDVIRLAHEHIRGVLDPLTESKVSTHLAHCRHCREQLERLREQLEATFRAAGSAAAANSNSESGGDTAPLIASAVLR